MTGVQHTVNNGNDSVQLELGDFCFANTKRSRCSNAHRPALSRVFTLVVYNCTNLSFTTAQFDFTTAHLLINCTIKYAQVISCKNCKNR